MIRTPLSVHRRLMRVQPVHQKREVNAATNADARALHVAERSMLIVGVPSATALKAASPKAAPVAAPAACVDPRITENVSENEINSHDAAFETRLCEQPRHLESKTPGKTGLRQGVRAAMTLSRLAGRELPANGRESNGWAD